MTLKQYYGKKVQIVDTAGEIFLGTVSDYFFPEDNEPELESIVIDTLANGVPVEFYEKNIETIEIIE